MRITRIMPALAVLAVIVAVSGVQSQTPAAPTGKELFLKYRCNSCHAIQSESIVKKASADDAEEKSDRKSPDLSSVGKQRTAAWMTKFLLKQEKIEGQLHAKKFRGTEPELKTLTAWLETLKTEAKKGK